MSESMTVKRPLFDRKSLTALILPLVVEQFLAMAIGAAIPSWFPAAARRRSAVFHWSIRSMSC